VGQASSLSGQERNSESGNGKHGRKAGSLSHINDFDALFAQRRREADEFYAELQRGITEPDARNVQRQALAGMIWSKQFFYYDVPEWIRGDPNQPPPPGERKWGRNREWSHLNNAGGAVGFILPRRSWACCSPRRSIACSAVDLISPVRNFTTTQLNDASFAASDPRMKSRLGIIQNSQRPEGPGQICDTALPGEAGTKGARTALSASLRRRTKRADKAVRARVPGRDLVYRDERFPTGVVTPTVAEPPGRLRKESARKGGRQTFDRRNTNGQ